MSDYRGIFDTVRPWLDAQGFNKPGRVDALDDACDRLPHDPNNSGVFEAVRPWLDQRGFTPDRISALDAACEHLRGAADPSIVAGILAAGAAAAAFGGTAAMIADGDDRYLTLFQRLASSTANADVVKAMARSFAAHAHAYGQDASKPRIAEFVAQIANETGGFRAFVENLNYRASVLVRQWPSHFTPAQAAAAVGNPVEIASRAYGGRGGNAPYPSHDGYTYRGRGALQLTFRNNYRHFGQLTGLPLEEQPDLAADPADSVLIALAFFKEGNVNHYIDAGNFKAARGITNAGNPNYPHPIGLEAVADLRAKALQVLG